MNRRLGDLRQENIRKSTLSSPRQKFTTYSKVNARTRVERYGSPERENLCVKEVCSVCRPNTD